MTTAPRNTETAYTQVKLFVSRIGKTVEKWQKIELPERADVEKEQERARRYCKRNEKNLNNPLRVLAFDGALFVGRGLPSDLLRRAIVNDFRQLADGFGRMLEAPQYTNNLGGDLVEILNSEREYEQQVKRFGIMAKNMGRLIWLFPWLRAAWAVDRVMVDYPDFEPYSYPRWIDKMMVASDAGLMVSAEMVGGE